jgi:hypothetical protein
MDHVDLTRRGSCVGGDVYGVSEKVQSVVCGGYRLCRATIGRSDQRARESCGRCGGDVVLIDVLYCITSLPTTTALEFR